MTIYRAISILNLLFNIFGISIAVNPSASILFSILLFAIQIPLIWSGVLFLRWFLNDNIHTRNNLITAFKINVVDAIIYYIAIFL